MKQTKNTLIYVISKDGKPLIPSKRCGAVRRWLRMVKQR